MCNTCQPSSVQETPGRSHPQPITRLIVNGGIHLSVVHGPLSRPVLVNISGLHCATLLIIASSDRTADACVYQNAATDSVARALLLLPTGTQLTEISASRAIVEILTTGVCAQAARIEISARGHVVLPSARLSDLDIICLDGLGGGVLANGELVCSRVSVIAYGAVIVCGIVATEQLLLETDPSFSPHRMSVGYGATVCADTACNIADIVVRPSYPAACA